MATTADFGLPVPQIVGPHGRAWRSNLAVARKKAENEDATLAIWIINAAWAHPIWHSYALFLVHLRPIADNRETLIYLEGATHELHLHALDPDKPLAPAIAGEKAPSVLTPPNFCAQLVRSSDDEALKDVQTSVSDICDRKLSPDTDFRQQWIALYGDNMLRPSRWH